MCTIYDMAKNCGTDNPPGTETILYVVPEEEITSFPPLKITTDPGDTVELNGDIVLDAVTPEIGYFRQIPIVSNSGQILSTMVGEVGGRSFDNNFVFFIKGNEADRLEFAQNMANCCAVFMLRDKAGILRVLGKLGDNAFAEAIATDTGLGDGGRRGTAYTIKYNGKIAPIYEGVIDLTPNP